MSIHDVCAICSAIGDKDFHEHSSLASSGKARGLETVNRSKRLLKELSSYPRGPQRSNPKLPRRQLLVPMIV